MARRVACPRRALACLKLLKYSKCFSLRWTIQNIDGDPRAGDRGARGIWGFRFLGESGAGRPFQGPFWEAGIKIHPYPGFKLEFEKHRPTKN